MTLEERIEACDSYEQAKYLIIEKKDELNAINIKLDNLRSDVSSKQSEIKDLVKRSASLDSLMSEKIENLAVV